MTPDIAAIVAKLTLGETPSSPKPDEIAREADDDSYWDYDDHECWQCGGEGLVTGCSWDWQCDTYDEGEGTCLCERRCHVCNPPPKAHLQEQPHAE